MLSRCKYLKFVFHNLSALYIDCMEANVSEIKYGRPCMQGYSSVLLVILVIVTVTVIFDIFQSFSVNK